MNRLLATTAALALGAAFAHPASAQLKVVSDQTVGGFAWPESVGCDAKNKLLYVGNFGSKLAPAEKDSAGYISKVALDGKVLDRQFLPAPDGEKISKPKGIWIRGNRLWTTDIDVVWVYDLKTRKGRKAALPGVVFANDPAVMGKSLYISDNRSDQIVKVTPADFLALQGEPKVESVVNGAEINPNGVWPTRDGMLLIAGFLNPDKPRGIHALGVSGRVKKIADPIGRLDGLYQLKDGSLLVTDWNSGSLFQWSEKMGVHKLADGFKGPADFCVMPKGKSLVAYVPDLVQSHLRIIELQ